MSRLRPVLLTLLTAASCAPTARPAPADPQILEIHPIVGPAEIRMNNGQIALTIVPALGGRIMSFGFWGGPNVLWTATQNSLTKRDWGDWSNVGGDKSWVWPQTDWKKRAGHEWPPPAEFDAAPWAVTKMQDGEVELMSPPLPHFHSTRLQRLIKMPRVGSRVIIQTTLLNGPAGNLLPMAAWDITQVPLPAAVSVRRQQSSGDEPIKPSTDGKSSLAEIDAKSITVKLGACIFEQRLLYATGPTRSRIYMDPRPDRPADAYAELEWAGDPAPAASRITVEWDLEN